MNLRNEGFALVEMMVVMGLLALAAFMIGGITVDAQKNYRRGTAQIGLQDDVRYAAQLLGDKIRVADDAQVDENSLLLQNGDSTLLFSLNGSTIEVDTDPDGEGQIFELIENVIQFQVDVEGRQVRVLLTAGPQDDPLQIEIEAAMRN